MIKTHHLNVGHGDTIIIEFFDTKRLMVIDMNRSSEFDDDTEQELITESLSALSSSDQLLYRLGGFNTQTLFEKAGNKKSLTDPVEYIKDLGYSSVFRFIQTHPHADHFTGMNALFEAKSVSNIWCVKNNFDVDESKLSDNQKADWKLLKKFRDTTLREVDGTTVVRPMSNESRNFWDEDNITVLSPTPDLVKLAEEKNNKNIMSYVLLIKHAGRKFIFGGDAEKETWEYILENFEDEIKDITVLDASHHGRDNGYYQPAVKVMNPQYVVVSVGKKPSTDASNKYRQYSDNVWSTRYKGNIVFTINDDGSGTYDTEY
jgi:beta-lactamase superfamily II metal-dependent hydrolase